MNTAKTTFTKEQLSNWRAYESVRKSGAYNMLDPRARAATGLSRDDYWFVLENYSELRAIVKAESAEE